MIDSDAGGAAPPGNGRKRQSGTIGQSFSSRRAGAPARTAGFTLLEVLIAFTIAGLALAVATGAAVESLRSVATASRYEQAVSRARSHLDTAGARLAPSDEQGDDGSGFRWHETIRAGETSRLREGSTPAARSGAPASLTLYAITARITWREGGAAREVRLDTSRLGAAAANVWSGPQPEFEAPAIPED